MLDGSNPSWQRAIANDVTDNVSSASDGRFLFVLELMAKQTEEQIDSAPEEPEQGQPKHAPHDSCQIRV